MHLVSSLRISNCPYTAVTYTDTPPQKKKKKVFAACIRTAPCHSNLRINLMSIDWSVYISLLVVYFSRSNSWLKKFVSWTFENIFIKLSCLLLHWQTLICLRFLTMSKSIRSSPEISDGSGMLVSVSPRMQDGDGIQIFKKILKKSKTWYFFPPARKCFGSRILAQRHKYHGCAHFLFFSLFLL